ncbi:MAG: wax ester/triacylglycerol synthase family O-acyltransferase [Betaproteobacteria bacterium]
MATPRREKVSAVDTAWLRMDRPHNLMMITGVLMFRERLAIGRLRRLVGERFLVFRRFRQRPVDLAGMAFWETERDLDLAHHVVHATLPAPGGRRELQALVSRLATEPLDPSRPRWQFHLVDRYEGGSAIVARIHHCYADGIALVRVMLSMTDASAHGPPAMPFEAPARKPEPDASDPLAQRMRPLSGVLDTARRIGATLVGKGVELWSDPSKAVALAGQGSALTAEIAKLALMEQDSPTRFKGKPEAEKRVAWADPIRLDEVKAIGKALGASINDVLLSCVAGALARYLREQGDDTDGVVVRALVPVNLRPIDNAFKLGNHFGLVFLDLPIGIENPIERLYAVRDNMDALKGSYQPVVALGVLAAMGAGPKMLQEALLALLARNATAVMTNVPGPQQPLWFAGARIDSLMFWVPQSGDIGIGVSILSYDGNVQFGLIADRKLCPDPEAVIDRFGREFETLVLATLMCPWEPGGDLDPERVAEALGALGPLSAT